MSAVIAIGFWGAFIGLVVYGLSCDAVHWFKNRREDRHEARRDALQLSRLAEREAHRKAEIADLDFAWTLPPRADGPRLAR